MTSLSDADINMQENEFSSCGDVIADDDFVDVSLETSDGSRDTNMESDVFRRGRWRRPLSVLWELLQVLLTTEGIMSSTHLWNYIPSKAWILADHLYNMSNTIINLLRSITLHWKIISAGALLLHSMETN